MKHWYTNNIEEHTFEEGTEPEGYVRGRLQASIDKQRKTELSKPEELRQLQYSKRAQTNRNANHKRTEEAREKMRKAKEGFVPWNKGLSKETDTRLAICSEKCRLGTLKHIEKVKLENPNYYIEWRTKARATMKQNGTSKSSKPEENMYRQLCEKYGADNVKRHYYDDRYPYECDFYIESEDLFIELNLHPSHYTHPFDDSSKEDLSILHKLKEEDSEWSKMIIDVWSIRDVEKLQCAIRNNLNYKQVYSNYIASRYSDVTNNK